MSRENSTVEKWADIAGYEGVYQVSDCGLVRSLDRVDSASRQLRGRYLRQSGSRYLSVALSLGGVVIRREVHRLVAETFIGPCPLGMEVAHYDGNRVRNVLKNLRYATRAQNHADKIRHGTYQYGEKNPNAKLRAEDVDCIRELASEGHLRREIGQRFGISPSHISAIVRKSKWA